MVGFFDAMMDIFQRINLASIAQNLSIMNSFFDEAHVDLNSSLRALFILFVCKIHFSSS